MARLRVLELFSGIGGAAASLPPAAAVVLAVDINTAALAVYRRNFNHPTRAATIESLEDALLERLAADLWWLSPPCQPFTRRGLARDDEDPRSRALLALLQKIERHRPRNLALENVPGFAGSRTHARLLATLARAAYEVAEELLCPSALGYPTRRQRYYLVASRDGLAERPVAPATRVTLAACLEHPLTEPPPAELALAPEVERHYRHALDVVDAEDPAALTACFTSAYGRSPVRSGSYLETPFGLRRFSPTEILRCLGFPPTFTLPPNLPPRRAWPLVGNSLAVPVVAAVLGRLRSSCFQT